MAGGSHSTVRGALLRLALRLARLPSLPPPDRRPGFDEAADALLRGEPVQAPEPRLEFLRWLAVERGVVFHGSQRGDLTELSTERKSRDSSAWGDRQAVYATTDPVWAVYFATLRRDNGWRGTRNGTIGRAGGPLYPRSYFFAHNRGSASPDRFGPGTVYLLPPETFVAEPPLAGVLDTAHLVSPRPVRPLAQVDVRREDFPFRGRIGYYRDREPIWVSMLRGRISGA